MSVSAQSVPQVRARRRRIADANNAAPAAPNAALAPSDLGSRAFAALFERAPVPYLLLDQKTLAVLRRNAAATRRYELGPENSPLNFADLCCVPDEAELRLTLSFVGSGGKTVEMQHQTAGGATLFVEATFWPLEASGRGCLVASLATIAEHAPETERAVHLSTIGETAPQAAPVPMEEAAPADDFDALFGPPAPESDEAAPRSLAPAPTDINSVVERTLLEAGASLRRAQVTTNVRMARGLPLIAADAAQLETALLALLQNAREAIGRMPHQVGAARLTLSTAQSDAKTLAVTIADNGPGIPAADLERIFEPGYTGRPYSAARGLGLTTARAIAEAHNGTLTVQSAPNNGAIFTLTLPIA